MKKLILISIFFLLLIAIGFAAEDRIRVLPPDNTTQWNAETGCLATEHHDCVNETPTDDGDLSFVECDTSALTMYDLFNTNASFVQGTHGIRNVTVYTRVCKETLQTNAYAPCVNVSGTTYCDTTADVPDAYVCPTYGTVSWYLEDSPDTLIEWTVAEVNAMLIGALGAIDCNPDIHMTQVYANVSWVVAEVTYCSGSAYNPPGNWDITATTTCTDENFGVDGNITISGSGSLTLIRTNITFNISTNDTFFFVNSADMWSINSTIRTNGSTVGFKFNISTGIGAGNVVQLNRTNITRASNETTDLYIYNSDNVVIKDSNITKTNSLYIHNSKGYLLINNTNLTLFGSTYGIKLENVTNLTFSDNEINADSIFIKNSNGSRIENSNLTLSDATYGIRLGNASYINITGNKINTTAGDGIYGYSLDWVNDTAIYDNWIYPANDEKGINIGQAGPRINITGNDIWGNGDVVYVASSSSMPSNLTIAYNNLNDIGAGNINGIYITYQDNATIFKNNVTTNYYGIYLYQMVDGNVTGNIVKTTGSTGYALGAVTLSSTNVFGNNFSSNGFGAGYVSGTSLTFYKNNFTLTTTVQGRMGMWLQGVSNSNFTENNVTIVSGSGDALNLTGSSNNKFYNNIISSLDDNAIMVYQTSTGNSFINDKLSSNIVDNDIYFNDSGTVNFTNVTFLNTKVSFNTGSTASLYVNWYVQGYVNATDASPIADANFSAWNISNAFLWWNWTSATGYTDWMVIQERIQNATNNISQQNTTFNATKSGYFMNWTSINVTISMQVNITLIASLVDTSFSITLPICSGNFSNSSETYPGNPTKYLNFTYNTSGCFAGNCPNVNPCVEGGTCCQNSTEPIYVFTNLGNVDLDWYINITAALPSWITMFWNNTDYDTSNVQTISAGTVTLINSSIPVNTNATLWIWANFTNAPAGAEWSNITSKANQTV